MTYINFKAYKTPADLQSAVDAYIVHCMDAGNGDFPNPAGLRIWLGITRNTELNYKNNPTYADYHEIMSAAYQFMEQEAWKDLRDGKGNFGFNFLGRVLKMSDKQEIEHTGKVDMPMIKIQSKDINFEIGD